MNTLSKERKIQILSALIEGNSIRSIERMTDTHRDTIMRLLVRIGKGCQKLLDENLKGFHSKYLEADEIWTFVQKKERRLTPIEKDNPEIGDQYVFVVLDAESKLIPTFAVGKRNIETTRYFIGELKNKLSENGRVQLTTDSFISYANVIEDYFGCEIDYAQQTKFYAAVNPGPGRYSPPKVSEVLSTIIQGNPDKKHICTSYVERHNLTMRMQLRRFTRLTNAYSKKLQNLKASLALYFAYYNFLRIHATLRMTPAMKAGITDHLWNWNNILAYESN